MSDDFDDYGDGDDDYGDGDTGEVKFTMGRMVEGLKAIREEPDPATKLRMLRVWEAEFGSVDNSMKHFLGIRGY